MALYSSAMDLRLAVPTPVHAQTDAALAGVEVIRRDAWRRRIERIAAGFVVDHGRPPVEPYAGGAPRNAVALAASARAKGWKVNTIELADSYTVEGLRGSEGWRATWVRGRAKSASWHEAKTRYALIEDTRPDPKANAMTRTSLANRRPVGVSRVHLTIVASPLGIPISVSALVAKVAAS